ncbi:MAG: hypothetical protein IJU66_04840 [Oscillospiraceae bacterium]|nr:hypothetical protein [Oscillospiraceae bacterium]
MDKQTIQVRRRRFLSLVMAAAVAFGMLPLNALAEEEKWQLDGNSPTAVGTIVTVSSGNAITIAKNGENTLTVIYHKWTDAGGDSSVGKAGADGGI